MKREARTADQQTSRSRRSNSNARYCGRCAMRSTMPMSIPNTGRPARLCQGVMAVSITAAVIVTLDGRTIPVRERHDRPDAKPRLPHGVRLAHNEAHGGWVLLAPERLFKADAIAVEILKRCNGEATFDAIVDDLANTFTAPRERIRADVSKLLSGLAERNCWSCELTPTRAYGSARRTNGHACRADPPLSARLSLLLQSARARAAEGRARHGDLDRGCSTRPRNWA